MPDSRKAAELVADFLERHEMRHVFGIIGAGNVHIFDAITCKGYTEIVCVHHEQAACMAIQTYYRMTGKPAAAILTTGGGSTNGLTGVVSAWMDSLPALIISGNESSKFTRPDNPLRIWGVQGYDSTGVVRKVTKYAARVMDPNKVVYELEKARYIAQHARPGPCWIDIPMDIQAASVDPAGLAKFDPDAEPGLEPVPAPQVDIEDAAGRALEMLREARRPVLWLGHGIRLAGAAHLVEPLLAALSVPVLVSWAGIDMLDSDHPLVYGRAGVYGQRCANFVLQNADLVFAIGTRLAIPQIGYALDEFARAAKLIVVDVDETEARKHAERVTLPVVADAGAFIKALLNAVGSARVTAPTDWIGQCDAYRRRYPWVGPEHADDPPYFNSYRFMEMLVRHFKPDQVVVTDVGPGLVSGHQVLRIKPGQRLMTSTGLGEMGYGLPGAIGASFARNRAEVMCLAGDGGMMVNLQELQTMAHYRLPIKLIIFNNDGYLMIKHTQKMLFSGRHSAVDRATGVSCPDFLALASAFGLPAYAIRNQQDFERVMPQVQAETGPVICEVFMHPEQPYVPKISYARRADGTLVPPPLEDLSPLLPREELRENMIVGMHPKSEGL
ncbi:MAG: thiamine pyrophosphate-binding protein [Betaproteobacteria bacterium]|nr:thiamine pyrophosphate-binding protein [Betaproteobacteria bacterium]